MPIQIYVMRIRFAVMRIWLGVMRNRAPTSRNLIVASQSLIVVMFAFVGGAAPTAAAAPGKVPPSEDKQGARQPRGARTPTAGAARHRRRCVPPGEYGDGRVAKVKRPDVVGSA